MDEQKVSDPHELVADFYKGLVAQKIPQRVAIALTCEWIRAMFQFAKDQATQSNLLVDWLKSQKLEKKD